jgi:shikimate kinase
MSPLAVLVGAPGAGKTTVGRRVAERLGCDFVDTDALIESSAGMSVSDIFVTQGEPEFRAMEERTIAEALASRSGIVSLGGGAVLSARTRDVLRTAPVIWLRVTLGDAAQRVGMNTARPLLLGNVRGTLSALIAERQPLYEEVASATVETSGRRVREVVDDVVRVIHDWGSAPTATAGEVHDA